MGGSGFGTPSGFTSRIDAARSGAGTVEATIADATSAFAGQTGLIIFPNPAASSSTAGTTATLAIRPAPATSGVGLVRAAGLPTDLVVPGGWTFRFSAIDPVTGVAVPGVTVSEANVVASDVSEVPATDDQLGPFVLVPGEGFGGTVVE